MLCYGGVIHAEYNVSDASWSCVMWNVLTGYPSNLCIVAASDFNYSAHK